MEIAREIIEQLADEVFKELEETARKAGREVSFEDMETAMLLYRQRIGNSLMQAAAEKVVSESKDQKKTVRDAEARRKEKATKRKR